jgi:hypothetical protein
VAAVMDEQNVLVCSMCTDSDMEHPRLEFMQAGYYDIPKLGWW